jgi:hypothetical protein
MKQANSPRLVFDIGDFVKDNENTMDEQNMVVNAPAIPIDMPMNAAVAIDL